MSLRTPVVSVTVEDGPPLVVAPPRPLPALSVADGEDAPPYVRAASALVAWQGGWIVVQDDAAWLARLDAEGRSAQGIALPAGTDARRVFEARLGNKHHKPDTEAAFAWRDTLYALGSGSAPGRDRWFALGPDGDPRSASWPAGYEALRACTSFAGRWLNVEGACVVDETLWLANRGNGGGPDTHEAVDALLAFDAASWVAALHAGTAPPDPRVCVAIAPAWFEGVRRTLTDLAAGPGGVWTLWSAEDSPNAVDDGEVLGSWLGVPDGPTWRLRPLVDAAGERLRIKAEGLAIEGGRAYIVTDADDVDAPSAWLSLALPPVAEPAASEGARRRVTMGV
jgi:hypothetical protein